MRAFIVPNGCSTVSRRLAHGLRVCVETLLYRLEQRARAPIA